MIKHLNRAWFMILSAALLMGIAVAPQLAKGWGLLLDIGWRLTLFCALLAASSRRRELWVALGVCILATLCAVTGNQSLREAGQFFDICILIYAALRILRFVFRGKVTANTIFAAVCIYLMLGQIFAQGLFLFESVRGQAIVVNVSGLPVTMEELVYFSYTTLTTSGFGDIRPITPFARSIVTVEALSGQLFLVLLIGRLVGLHVSRKALSNETV